MKVEINPEQPEKKPEYPYLGIHKDGTIVMFRGIDEGICVRDGGSTKIGFYAKHFAEGTFQPYTGTITLSNE